MVHWWSEEEVAYLRENYPIYTRPQLVEKFNEHFNVDISVTQLKGALKRYNVLSGRDGKFQKGQVPVNKGKKYPGQTNKTSFKKGQKAINHRPVGSERINIYGYVEIKVAEPMQWRLKHIVIWEEVHGPIPENHCLLFLDSNKQNVSLDNLRLVSRSQLARLNQNHLISENAEVTKTGIILADIYGKIGELSKKAK